MWQIAKGCRKGSLFLSPICITLRLTMKTGIRTPHKDFALLALAGTIWGAQPLLVKFLVQDISPSSLSACRFFLVSATIFCIMWRKGIRLLPPLACIVPLLCMGVAGISVNNIAQFTGLTYSTVGNATLIASTTPVLTALLGAVVLRERLHPLQWLGIFIALGGVLFLITRGSLAVICELSFNYGDLLFFFSQLGWAVYTLLGFRVMKKMEPLAVTAWSGLFGAMTTLAYSLWAGEMRPVTLSAPNLLCFAYIVWLGGVAATIFWNRGVNNVGPGQTVVFMYIMPVVGVLAGIIFLDEPFYWQEFLGAVAIFAGVGLMAMLHIRAPKPSPNRTHP